MKSFVKSKSALWAVLHCIDVILKFSAGFNKKPEESLLPALKLLSMEVSVMNSKTFQ